MAPKKCLILLFYVFVGCAVGFELNDKQNSLPPIVVTVIEDVLNEMSVTINGMKGQIESLEKQVNRQEETIVSQEKTIAYL